MRCGTVFLETNDLRGNELREPFPHEDGNEYKPEKLDALLLKEDLLAAVKGVEQLNGGEQIREHDVRGVHQEGAHDTWSTLINWSCLPKIACGPTSKTIPEQLRS